MKKLTRKELQSTLRTDVSVDSRSTPATSKPTRSPKRKPSVLAKPDSTLMPLASSGVQRPCTKGLLWGNCALYDTLNSRSTSRRARSSAKSCGVTALPLTVTKRARIMGYQS